MSPREKIYLVLTYTKNIEDAILEKRLDPNRPKSGSGNGHCRVSDPTAMQAIFNSQELDCVLVYYGTEINGKRKSFTLERPESWVDVAKATRGNYAGTIQYNLMEMYFNDVELTRKEICHELQIGATYYNSMLNDIFCFARAFAMGRGLIPQRYTVLS